MTFTTESAFEEAVIKMLSEHGWESAVLKNYTEKQLIQNWADILFENNRDIDSLNNCPLTEGEMLQILEQIAMLKSPLKLNGFINGQNVTITRDNEADTLHYGKEVSLKIYDRREIAAGQSRYQIVQQPKFPTASPLLNNRRGDLMLLINGMPVIHMELKKSGVPVSQACRQIEKYTAEGVFSGLFSLVQMFVGMTPEETLYFANPGIDGRFNPDYYFHWADVDNEPVNDWKSVISTLLSIPMAHQMIGFYTVADNSDGVLKVMRSYQFFAASKISDKVAQTKWDERNQLGGFVWHTTGSGKTMTSFKSAQLIATSKDADKVIFLMDRIELGTQSLKEYRGFAGDSLDVQATENTGVLVTKLKSSNPSDTLIVTSIQKMNNIKNEAEGGLKAADIELMSGKRIVFIVDECHRSTFGDMLINIKNTFPRAIFFGFSGTPIHEENQKKDNTTTTVFGDELHRYSIADGIRDKNVLGFDPYKVLTYEDSELKTAVALEKAKAHTVEEAYATPAKAAVFQHYMGLPMPAVYEDETGTKHGIEHYLPNSQYEREEHQQAVIADILKNWVVLSHNGKFHAIFATASIQEAVQYYRRMKAEAPNLKISAIFDANIDNNGHGLMKEQGLVEIIKDYNARYGQDFSIPTFAGMKKDIAARLAHKRPYERIDKSPEQQLDLLIVVDQMLTGFDSKWINTLYLDKMLYYENLIQAFSRTNRLFGLDKPFGTIRYYRKPHTMERNVQQAVKLYSGDKPLGLFVEKLNRNLESLNTIYQDISDLFNQAGIEDFSHLPAEPAERKEFARLFRDLNARMEAAKIQGFRWDKRIYQFADATMEVALDEHTFNVLSVRYNELFGGSGGESDGHEPESPYDIPGFPIPISTGAIDNDYMNSRFEKFRKLLGNATEEELRQTEQELHKSFAFLSQEEQKYADIFLHDIKRGDVVPVEGKTFRDYVTEYMAKAQDDRIHRFAAVFGLDETLLRGMMSHRVTEGNINDFGRFDALKATADKKKAKAYFETGSHTPLPPPKVAMKLDKILRDFITNGGFDLS
ncbi:type I restriction endonuclease subunit R [Akkermansia muciniphila]|uniref:type I restriction endonuclease subunit R n=1 Tax=Akkermansia muciniphila TaxID=239935 RepID=UPI000B8E628F|nr:HsdR family type I site-specific deoxyribonuclease [Akkermansia muciniphila]